MFTLDIVTTLHTNEHCSISVVSCINFPNSAIYSDLANFLYNGLCFDNMHTIESES